MIKIRIKIILLLLVFLVGCSTIKSTKTNDAIYSHAHKHAEVLSLPSEMQNFVINDTYSVPQVQSVATCGQSTEHAQKLLLPPGSVVAK